MMFGTISVFCNVTTPLGPEEYFMKPLAEGQWLALRLGKEPQVHGARSPVWYPRKGIELQHSIVWSLA
jgi:hypothetical protein